VLFFIGKKPHNGAEMSRVVNVLIVDDHPPVRDGIKSALSHSESIKIVGEAETGEELEELLMEVRVDVVVLDISLPDRSGIDVLYMMHNRFPSVRVIVLSMYNRADYIIEALQAGAAGYMTKETSPVKLIEGIRMVTDGDYFFDSRVMKTVVDKALEHPQRYYDVEDKAYENLTAREQEIMRLLAEGFSVRRVAQSLSISYRTVENHRTSIFRKLNVKNSAELVHYARKLGVIDFD
jgi:DNA-binding NarL/FixJ family response regulator